MMDEFEFDNMEARKDPYAGRLKKQTIHLAEEPPMNQIETLDVAVRELLPGVDADLVRPRDPDGRWALGLTYQGWYASVFWIRGKAYGLSVGAADDDEAAYGEGQDALYPNDDPKQFAGVIASMLRERRETTGPRAVTLRELRNRLGVSQAELAERLDVGQAAVSKMERRDDLALSTLARWAKALGAVELEVWVRFPDDAPVKLAQIPGSLRDDDAEGKEHGIKRPAAVPA